MAVTLGSTGVTFPDASIQTTAAGASALVYISQAVASNSATVSFTGLTAYDNYMVIFSKIAPSSTDEANNFLMYTSTNNGSSYATTSYNYAMSFVITSSASVGVKASEADGNTFIRLSAGTFSSNNSNCSISGDITLNLKDSTKYFFLAWGVAAQLNAGGRTVNNCFSAGRPESSATNAIRFQFSTGNVSSGTFRLYGIVNS